MINAVKKFADKKVDGLRTGVRRAFLIATEPVRAADEARQFPAALRELGATMPHGDGHPVLVIPGFSAHDLSTLPLRHALDKMGYKTFGWEAGINAGLTEKKIRHLYQHLEGIYEENGCQKVTIIGHSLGGLVARCLAHEFPDMIAGVITLGSPFGVGAEPDEVPKWLVNIIQKLNDKEYTLKKPGMSERLLTPAKNIPHTSISSIHDGIGGYKACLNPDTPLAENIILNEASHTGLVCNGEVLAIVLDRLAQLKGQFEKRRKWSRWKKPEIKSPVNPEFELTDENSLLQDVPVESRKKSKKPLSSKKTTSPSNSARRRPAARPS